MKRTLSNSIPMAILLLLAGCMVGPRYSKPTVPLTPAYKELPPDAFKDESVCLSLSSHLAKDAQPDLLGAPTRLVLRDEMRVPVGPESAVCE